MSAPHGIGAELRRELTRRIVQAQREWRAPAVSAGLVRDGELVWSEHVGAVDLDTQRVATNDTQFLIGSITKTFTAIAVMQLRDEGRLDLDDTVGTFLPDSRHARVPLRQMLAHASGLQREPVGHVWEDLQAPDREAFVAGLESAEQVLAPHSAFHYSNLAYGVLGEIVHRVSGVPWEQWVASRITEPLGMSRTSLTPLPDRAHGYHVDPYTGVATAEPIFAMAATAPIGGLWSSVADLGRFGAYLADPDDRVLAPSTVAQMCVPIILTDETWTGGYGLGFAMVRRGERVFVGHGGAMPGFLAGLRVSRAERTVAVVFANTTAGAAPSMFAAQLLDHVADTEPAQPTAWVPERPQPQLREVLGQWWTEGSPIVFFVRDGRLCSRIEGTPGTDSVFVDEGPDRYRVSEGRERGEVLQVVRNDAGGIEKMYFATYAVTRDPLAFGELTPLSRP